MVQNPDVSGELPTAKDLFFKTRVCKFYMAGRCKRGKNCTFAHGDGKVQPLPDFYKTRLCATLLRTGKCDLGDQCGYAHSKADMRDSAKPVAEATRVAAQRATKATTTRKSDKDEQDPGQPEPLSPIALGPNAPFMSLQPTEDDLVQPPASMLPQQVDRQAFLTATAAAALAERASQVPFPSAPQLPQRAPPPRQPQQQWKAAAAPPRPAGFTAQSLAQSGIPDMEPDQLALLATLLNRSKSIQSRVNENPGVLNNATLMAQIQALLAAHAGRVEAEPPQARHVESDVTPSPQMVNGRYEMAFGRSGMQSEPTGSPGLSGMPSYANPRNMGSSGAFPNSRQSRGGLSGMDMPSRDLDPRLREWGPLGELSSGLQKSRLTPVSEPTGIPLWQSPPPQQVPPPQDVPPPREHGLRLSESMMFRAEKAALGLQLGESMLPRRDKANYLPQDLLVKNTFLEVGESNEFKGFSQFAVHTAPELPQIYEEMSEDPLSHLGVGEEQGSTEARHLYDRAASQFSSSEQQGPAEPRRLTLHDRGLSRFSPDLGLGSDSDFGCGGRSMLDANSLGFDENSTSGQDAWTLPSERLPTKRSSSSSSLQEMVVKNTFLDVKSVEPALNKHKIESLPNLPWLFSTGHRPGSAGDPHEDSDVDASHMDPPGFGDMAPTLADGVQFPAPPPGLTSLTRSFRGPTDVADHLDLVRDPRPASHTPQSDWKAPEPLPPELLELAALKGGFGKGAPKGMGTPEPRWAEGQDSQPAFAQPRRQAWEGNSSGHGDLGLIVKNTFLEAATEEDQALAAALAQHAVRTAPELPLLSSWANL